MRVTVKLASALRAFTDNADVAENGRTELELAADTTALDVLKLMNIPENQRLMVIVDDRMIARSELENLTLQDGQTLSLNPPIQAG